MTDNRQEGYVLFSWECIFYTDETLPYDIRENNGYVKLDDVERDCNILLEAGAITGAVETATEVPFGLLEAGVVTGLLETELPFGNNETFVKNHYRDRVLINEPPLTRYFFFDQGHKLESFTNTVKTTAWYSPPFDREDLRYTIKNARFLTALSQTSLSNTGQLGKELETQIWRRILGNDRGAIAELTKTLDAVDYGRKLYHPDNIEIAKRGGLVPARMPKTELKKIQEHLKKMPKAEFERMLPFLEEIKNISSRGPKKTEHFMRAPDDLRQRINLPGSKKFEDLHPDFAFGTCERGGKIYNWVRRKIDKYPRWILKTE